MRVWSSTVFLTVYFLSMCPAVHASIASENYRISSYVLSGGGGPAVSASFRMNATAGQPSPLPGPSGNPFSGSYNLHPGFWPAIDSAEQNHDKDSDGDGIVDAIEIPGCTDELIVDSDGDLIDDGVEDANKNGDVDPGETNPCKWDTDLDGLADGEEDANQNGVRDDGELDPLDFDSDDDDYGDGLEVALGTNPLSSDSWPYIICIGDFDPAECDDSALTLSDALALISDSAAINYLRIRNANLENFELQIEHKILVGIESGQVTFQP